jgi:hypothetical protein
MCKGTNIVAMDNSCGRWCNALTQNAVLVCIITLPVLCSDRLKIHSTVRNVFCGLHRLTDYVVTYGCPHNSWKQLRLDWICKACSELVLINTPRSPSLMQFFKVACCIWKTNRHQSVINFSHAFYRAVQEMWISNIVCRYSRYLCIQGNLILKLSKRMIQCVPLATEPDISLMSCQQ